MTPVESAAMSRVSRLVEAPVEIRIIDPVRAKVWVQTMGMSTGPISVIPFLPRTHSIRTMLENVAGNIAYGIRRPM